MSARAAPSADLRVFVRILSVRRRLNFLLEMSGMSRNMPRAHGVKYPVQRVNVVGEGAESRTEIQRHIERGFICRQIPYN